MPDDATGELPEKKLKLSITCHTCKNSLRMLNNVTVTMTVVATIGPASSGLAAGLT